MLYNTYQNCLVQCKSSNFCIIWHWQVVQQSIQFFCIKLWYHIHHSSKCFTRKSSSITTFVMLW